MEKLKSGTFVYSMPIPIKVLYSRGDDGHVSVDSVCAPDEDEIYRIVDKNAKQIKMQAGLRGGI